MPHFSFAAFEQALGVLQRLVQGRESVILVIGDEGSGKTTFLRAFMQNADNTWQRCKLKVKAATGVDNPADRLVQRRESAFVSTDTAIPVIMIDDAHYLSKAELKSLLRDAYTPRKKGRSKRLVLFGDPSINAKVTAIAESEGGQFIINRIHMPRLNREETAAYIRQRLSAVGYEGKMPFTPAVVRRIFRDSGGVPEKINQASRQRLENGFGSPVFALTPKLPKSRLQWFLVALLGVAALALVATFYTRQASHIKSARSKPRLKNDPIQASVARKVDSGKPGGTAAVGQPSSTGTSGESGSQMPQALRHNRPLPSIPAIASPVPYDRLAHKKPPVRREQWLLRQNDAYYTIQLIGVRNEQSLLTFIERHTRPMHQPLAYYKTTYKGGVWYPLLYGVYPSAEQAREAINTLPEPIRGKNPWIRRLSAIQGAIRKNAPQPPAR